MSLHTEYLFLNQARNAVDNSENIFDLADLNKYVIKKAKEYAKYNNKEKAGEYFILHCEINEKMSKMPFKRHPFRVQ